MAAIGPDFKRRFVDPAPVSNADIAPTIAHLLGVVLPSKGTLRGRVLSESLRGNGTAAPAPSMRRLESMPAADRRTVLYFQEFGELRYIARGCFVPLTADCP